MRITRIEGRMYITRIHGHVVVRLRNALAAVCLIREPGDLSKVWPSLHFAGFKLIPRHATIRFLRVQICERRNSASGLSRSVVGLRSGQRCCGQESCQHASHTQLCKGKAPDIGGTLLALRGSVSTLSSGEHSTRNLPPSPPAQLWIKWSVSFGLSLLGTGVPCGTVVVGRIQ